MRQTYTTGALNINPPSFNAEVVKMYLKFVARPQLVILLSEFRDASNLTFC